MDDTENFVYKCYKAILGREPDDTGFKGYVKAVREGRIGIKDLPHLFIESQEFKEKIHSGYGNLWKPKTFEHAKQLILSSDGSTPTTDFFEGAGKLDGEILSSFVNENFQIVDYGCGVGRVAKFLSKKVKAVYGIDVSKQMLNLAKDFCKECSNIEFLKSDGIKIPLENDSIDFVYSLLVLQHVEKEDAYLILKEMNRILKSGCKIYLSFPDLTSEAYWKNFEGYANNPQTRSPAKARMYTIPEVKIMMEKVGFKILEITDHNSKESTITKIIDDNIRVIATK